MKSPGLVVFDIAGTTVRDKGNVARAFREAMQQAGYPISTEHAQLVMGYKKSDAIRILLRQQGELLPEPAAVEKILDDFNERMISFYQTTADLKPFDGVEDLFHWLRENGIRIALNTGFSRNITQTILDRLQWETGQLVDATVTSDEVVNGRPAPDMIYYLMEQLNVKDPLSVIKVGDTESDIAEGRQAGCGMVVAVTTGAYSREQLEVFQPDYILDDLHALKDLLNKVA